MSDEIAIQVSDVSKTFRLPHEKQSSIKGMLIHLLRGGKRTYEKQQVLKDISFEVKKGEFFGIVGRNGSGKSTLLKLLAGIYTPSKGNILINGKLTPFIELGVGFNPELTGRENVFLNGALLGFNRKEMLTMYEDIVEFAELERFMDQKLKNYSSGMQVRLAFSIAIRAKSDILLIDEVLAVGDAAFQRKCLNYFGNLKSNKQTVVFITHDMGSVRKYCDRAILIDNGVIQVSGETEKAITSYMQLFLEEPQAAGDAGPDDSLDLPIGMSPTAKLDKTIVKITKAWIENQAGKKVTVLDDTDDTFSVKFKIEALKPVKGIIPGVVIRNMEGEFITATNSKWAARSLEADLHSAGESTIVSFKLPNIYEQGDYMVSVNVVAKDFETFLAWQNKASSLYLSRKFITGAKAHPKYEVGFTK